MGASALKWTVLLHHNTHVHTFVAGTGFSGSFQAEDHGDIGTFSYEIILEATDSSGLKRRTSVNVPVGSDTIAAVGAHGAPAAASSPSRIDLNWTASTDNAAVSGYRVERCQGAGCTNFAQVGTPTARPRTATRGLSPSTTYRYRVRAVDASGNLGAYSSIAAATTPGRPGHPAGPGRGLGVQRGSGHHYRRRLRQRQPGDLGGRRHLVDAGPLRRRR